MGLASSKLNFIWLYCWSCSSGDFGQVAINSRRFHRERKLKRQFDLENDANINYEDETIDELEQLSELCYDLQQDFEHEKEIADPFELHMKQLGEQQGLAMSRWACFLRHSDYGLVQFIIISLQVYLLFINCFRSTVYSVLPTNLDPETGLYVNPVLRTLNAWNLRDHYNSMSKAGLVNFCLAPMDFQFLFQRLRCLFIIAKESQSNKYYYKDINVMQVNFGPSAGYRTTFAGWMQLTALAMAHQCKFYDEQDNDELMLSCKFSKLVRKLDKIDRIYYFNQLDFTTCMAEVPFDGRGLRDIMGSREECEGLDDQELLAKIDQPINDDPSGPRKPPLIDDELLKSNKLAWLRRFVFRTHGLHHQTAFYPIPGHKLHLTQFAALYNVLVGAMPVVAFCVIVGTVMILLSEMIKNGFDRQRWDETFDSSLQLCIEDGTFEKITVEFCAWITSYAMNQCEVAIMLHAAAMFHSRLDRIAKILECQHERQSKIWSRFSLQFLPEWLDSQAPSHQHSRRGNSSGNLSLTSQHDQDVSSILITVSPIKRYKRLGSDDLASALNGDHHEHQDHGHHDHHGQDFDDYVDSNNSAMLRHENSKWQQTEVSIRKAKVEFKSKHLAKAEVDDINERLEYIITLIEVVQAEFHDYKKYFTRVLDINILLGAGASSVAFAMVLGTWSSVEWGSLLCIVIAISVPLSYTMIMCIVTEWQFRKVHLKLMPVMIDELEIVDRHVMKALHHQHNHLAKLDQRSYVALSNFPVTLDSVGSIMAWIVTFGMLVQRIFSE